MFWQGGFFFYVSAVVPTAKEEIGHKRQGLITRRVTVWINNAAILSLGMLAADALIAPDRRRWRRRWVWGIWLAMAMCQVAIGVMHRQLNALMAVTPVDGGIAHVEVDGGFRPLHLAYVWTHTVQSVFAVTYLSMLVSTWRLRDRTSNVEEV